jgi:hypothetical protein|tara:strand:+ start:536 stop:1300 length:765 start_codon:yes stop_codon:yes gene_type:complete
MAKLKLKTIVDGKDKNRYCGPSAISALTDLTTGQAARLIRKQHGRSSIRGSYTHEVLDALRACNIKADRWRQEGVRLNRTNGPTLAAWLRLTKKDRTPGRIFLLIAGWHWQLISGRRYTCGRIRDIVSIKDKRVKRRARVCEVWELTSDNVTKPDIDVSKPKSKSNPAYYQIRKLIKQYPEFGLTYEVEHPRGHRHGYSTHYWAEMSSELEKLACEMDHELQDEHGCEGIDEVLDRMKEMVEFGKEHYPTINKQ